MKRFFAVVLFLLIALASLAQEENKTSLILEARGGDVGAMFRLGKSYLVSGVESDYPEAYKWLSRASDKGHIQAKSAVAYMLKNGLGVQEDLKEAEDMLGVPLKANDGLAWWLMAQMADNSGKDPWIVRGFVENALRSGYPLARLFYAKYFSTGSQTYGITKDGYESLRLLKLCADAGEPDAAALYGIMLLRQGDAKSGRYLKMAAEGGNPAAMAQVANMYYTGRGVEKDESQTFLYYKKSADKGDLSGIEGLADCYRLGIGTGGIFNVS